MLADYVIGRMEGKVTEGVGKKFRAAKFGFRSDKPHSSQSKA
jgi:hypothetical protein